MNRFTSVSIHARSGLSLGKASHAVAAMLYGAAGVDYSLTPSLSVLTEARFDASRAKMNKDFQGFNRIDLSGLAVTAGLNVRF